MKQPKSIHSLLVNPKVTASWEKKKLADFTGVRKCLGNRTGRDKIKHEN